MGRNIPAWRYVALLLSGVTAMALARSVDEYWVYLLICAGYGLVVAILLAGNVRWGKRHHDIPHAQHRIVDSICSCGYGSDMGGDVASHVAMYHRWAEESREATR